MGKEILNKVIPHKSVGKSGCAESGRVTIDAKELYSSFVNKVLVDINVIITEHDEDKLVQETTK